MLRPTSPRPRVRALRAALTGLALAVSACTSVMHPVPTDLDDVAQLRAESLATSAAAIAGGVGNWGRYGAAWRRIEALGLSAHARSEWIDPWSLQRNIVIEIPGRSDRIVYLVANYDKVAHTPLRVVSQLLNGMFDSAFSLLPLTQGAVVNAGGVAVVLEHAARAAKGKPELTYRILLPALGEQGLRGTRAHLARLSAAEKERVAIAIDVHGVGADWTGTCISGDAGDPERARFLRRALRRGDARIGISGSGQYPVSDYAALRAWSFSQDVAMGVSHNLVGGLLPQRSWFGTPHAIPIAQLSACGVDDFYGQLSYLIPLPMGRVHGPRDSAARLDPRRLWEAYEAVRVLVREIEGSVERRAKEPEPTAPPDEPAGPAEP